MNYNEQNKNSLRHNIICLFRRDMNKIENYCVCVYVFVLNPWHNDQNKKNVKRKKAWSEKKKKKSSSKYLSKFM